MGDGTGLAEAILGLDGFQVLAVDESAAEVLITIETTPRPVGCRSCGAVAEIHPNAPAGKRNAPQQQARIWEDIWVDYEPRWDLLDIPTELIPVLLAQDLAPPLSGV
ncbi:MAG: hypothetical protein ACYCSF_12710 [Acidimicrobiales bacterium]